jgi:uncharacterized protein YecE (DUF72 family)
MTARSPRHANAVAARRISAPAGVDAAGAAKRKDTDQRNHEMQDGVARRSGTGCGREGRFGTGDAHHPLREPMSIHIGTSGWAYREWRGFFYPPKMRPEALLRHYAQEFRSVEINGTAYRTPTPQTVEAWRSALPPGFIAAVKMAHAVTHRRHLRHAQRELVEYFAAVGLLGDRRGPVLVQLPPSLGPDLGLLRDFLQLARAAMADPAWKLVLEFRQPGWISGAVEQLLGDQRATWCLSDIPVNPVDRPTAGADLVYLRRHGTEAGYRGSYGEAALHRDAELIAAWAARGAEVFAFFNNTADGSAIADARRLRRMLAGSAHEAEPAFGQRQRIR